MTSKELCLQEEVFLDQEPVQPVLHGPQDQGQGAEGGQDHQRVNHEWRRQKNGNQTKPTEDYLNRIRKEYQWRRKTLISVNNILMINGGGSPAAKHSAIDLHQKNSMYYEKNSTKWVQISERINWCSIKMPRKNIEIVSQSSPLTKMAKIVIF